MYVLCIFYDFLLSKLLQLCVFVSSLNSFVFLFSYTALWIVNILFLLSLVFFWQIAWAFTASLNWFRKKSLLLINVLWCFMKYNGCVLNSRQNEGNFHLWFVLSVVCWVVWELIFVSGISRGNSSDPDDGRHSGHISKLFHIWHQPDSNNYCSEPRNNNSVW